MKVLSITLIMLLLIPQLIVAQAPIRVYVEQDSFKKNYRLLVEKTKTGTFTCTIHFTQLLGLTCSEGNDDFSVPVSNYGITQIATITPILNATQFSFNYTSKYIRGESIAKPDTLYPYLLPGSEGRGLLTSSVSFIGDIIGKGEKEFYAIGFTYRIGDTICASRGGLIIETFDQAEPRKENELYSNKTRNNITIEHKDRTIAKYSILSSIKLLVKEGDHVIPGQPLAVFEKEERNFTMLLSVYYLNLKKLSETGSNYFTLQPRFALSPEKIDLLSPNSFYQNELHPNAIITKEMSNKEMKKLGLKH